MSRRNADFSSQYQMVAALMENGVELQVNGGGYGLQIAGLHDEGGMICQFHCDGMSANEILDLLEELARRHEEEGIATDDVNGTEFSVW